MASGQVKKGDHLTLLPGAKRVRVRGIQAHNESVETISAGGRCALNLAGVDKEALQRGMMVCDPRLQRAAHTVDVSLSLVPGLDRIPKSHRRVRFHSGTAEPFARIALRIEFLADALHPDITYPRIRFDCSERIV